MKTFYKTLILTGVVLLTTYCKERPVRLEGVELFPDGKPLGQPYTAEMSDIRMVRVSSVREADSIFAALSRNINYGNVVSYPLPDGDSIRYSKDEKTGNKMIYTHRMQLETYEVGIIYIQDPAVNAKGIREIHFVETVKLK